MDAWEYRGDCPDLCRGGVSLAHGDRLFPRAKEDAAAQESNTETLSSEKVKFSS